MMSVTMSDVDNQQKPETGIRLTDEQQRFVVGSIRQFLDAHAHAHLAAADRAA